jgi:predicted nucleotidyltransferase
LCKGDDVLAELFPDPARNRRLLTDIIGICTALPYVQRLISFGSFARGEPDRWSDIDLIVVTVNRAQFWSVFTCIAQSKPILHRSYFTPQVEPSGGRVLGMVFENESVFHNVDLNFMTRNEYASLETLMRFGVMRELYVSSARLSDADCDVLPNAELEHPDDRRISVGLHFTKKAIKQVLRGQMVYEELQQRSRYLRDILEDYAYDVATPYGKIGQVAHQYLEMAEQLLLEDKSG